jgi:hypothetical protein
MICAIEQEALQQRRIAGDGPRTQARGVRSLRQAGEDDEVPEIAAEPVCGF